MWKRIPLVVLVLGVCATLVGAHLARTRAINIELEKFSTRSQHCFRGLVEDLRVHEEAVAQLGATMAINPNVTRDEFIAITSRQADLLTGVHALAWVPVIEQNDRAQFEASLREEGFVIDSLKRWRGETEWQQDPAQWADRYVPVKYANPLEGNQRAIGIDLGSNPARADAIAVAERTRSLAATAPIPLLNEPGVESSFLLFSPVFPSDRTDEKSSKTAIGYAVGVFRIPEIVTSVLSTRASGGLQWYITDQSEKKQPVYIVGGDRSHAEGSIETRKLEVGGRFWTVQASCDRQYLRSRTETAGGFELFAGLIISQMMFLLIRILVNQHDLIALEVSRQTDELKVLSRQQQRNQFTADASIEAIYWVNEQARFIYVNDAACEMLGYSRDELLNLSVVDIDSKWPESRWVEHWKMMRDKRFITLETSHVGADGQSHWVGMHVHFYEFEGDEFLVGTAIDISLRKRAELALRESEHELEKRRENLEVAVAALQRSNKDLEHFAHIASHDLQTPLRTISGFASLLEEDYADRLDADGVEYIHDIIDGCDHMRELVRNILEYSRVEATKRPEESVCLNELIDSIENSLKSSLDESNGVIFRDDLPTYTGDRSQLFQLFQNLIGNGIKYRGEQPPVVRVAALETHTAWVIAVSDNGIGIPESQVERVFEPFYRLHGKDQYTGTGIGLAICQRIVELHKGEIHIEAGQGGQGTTVKVLLPKPVAVRLAS